MRAVLSSEAVTAQRPARSTAMRLMIAVCMPASIAGKGLGEAGGSAVRADGCPTGAWAWAGEGPEAGSSNPSKLKTSSRRPARGRRGTARLKRGRFCPST